MSIKKSDVQIHFNIMVKQINERLQKSGKEEILEVIYHNDNCLDLNKVCKNGDKEFIKISCSAIELSIFLEGFDTFFKFE